MFAYRGRTRPGLQLVPVLFVACLMRLSVLPASAQEVNGPPRVLHELGHGVSPRLSDIVPVATPPAPVSAIIRLGRPALPPEAPQGQDPALQKTSGPLVGTTTALGFEGISAHGVAPPDTNLSVSATQVVQVVNVEYAVYNKTGGLLAGPLPLHNLWSGLTSASSLCRTVDGGDPIVLYDKAAGRWLISQLAYNSNFSSNSQCIAVSQTSDATGSYNAYEFSFGNNLPDYPKFGVWPDAYYFSANIFQNGSSFRGAMACAFDRSAMLNNQNAIGVCFQRSTSDASLLPSDMDSTPPSGSPNFYLELATSSSLKLYRFHAEFNPWTNSTFTSAGSIPVASYSIPCSIFSCISVPQPGTGQKLDSLGDRLMYRLAYRNFPDHE